MEAEEHFYTDDPSIGPADARTTLKGVDYFFVGNGLITAAVQLCSSGEGTTLGLILTHPEIFGPKRNALTFDSQSGLAQTSLKVTSQNFTLIPDSSNADVWWEDLNGLPVIQANWGNDKLKITERFYCPDLKFSRIIREIHLTSYSVSPVFINIQTGVRTRSLETPLVLRYKEEEVRFLEYQLGGEQAKIVVELSWVDEPEIAQDTTNYWRKIASCQFDSPLLNHFFTASRNQLSANIADSGRLDASIWQYNLEWVRDQAMIALGLIVSGQFEPARIIMDRLLSKFVTEKGDTLDSSQERPTSEVELDQNGELLLALRTYVDWTGDLAIVKKHWQKVCATANFPLQTVFRQPGTALLHNQREYWERHALYGIEDGMELAYQLFVSMGLSSAAYLAELLGHSAEMKKWRLAAEDIKQGILSDPKFALIHNGHFIKRRYINGNIQSEVHVKNGTALPKDIPILAPGKHYLNPDSSSVLPIAFEFVDPKSELAKKTLEQVEKLWNQTWQGGGYSRYNVTSEPDSPGPWPFPSLFIAKAYLEMEEDEKVWRILKWLNSVAGSKSGTWFEFYGPRPIPPCPQIGIAPWTWAEQLIFFVHHLLGIRPTWNKLLIRPRILSGIEKGEASIRLRNFRLNINLEKVEDNCKAAFKIDGVVHPYVKCGILIDMPKRDLDIEILFP